MKIIRPATPMFFNSDVSIGEEIEQAKLWKDAQRCSEKRSRKLFREWLDEMRPPEKKNEVTAEMIERAKEFPIENMLEVTRGVARCISGEHEDKRPSMQIKHNRVKCFSCGYKNDTIGVAQTIYGISFHEAVKKLQ